MLHEACGRIINPTYGSVGLIWSENWEQCQAAVESVLQGSTIMQLPTNNNVALQNSIMPLEGCDIRHLSKNPNNEDHRAQILKLFKRPRGGLQAAGSSNNSTISHESISVENDDKHGNEDESEKVFLELTLG